MISKAKTQNIQKSINIYLFDYFDFDALKLRTTAYEKLKILTRSPSTLHL